MTDLLGSRRLPVSVRRALRQVGGAAAPAGRERRQRLAVPAAHRDAGLHRAALLHPHRCALLRRGLLAVERVALKTATHCTVCQCRSLNFEGCGAVEG